MSSHNKTKQKRDNKIQDIGSDDGQKTDQTITYSRNKPKTQPKSLTKGHKIFITILVVLVVAGIFSLKRIKVQVKIQEQVENLGQVKIQEHVDNLDQVKIIGTRGQSGSGENHRNSWTIWIR